MPKPWPWGSSGWTNGSQGITKSGALAEIACVTGEYPAVCEMTLLTETSSTSVSGHVAKAMSQSSH
jgi:hypothetical protein